MIMKKNFNYCLVESFECFLKVLNKPYTLRHNKCYFFLQLPHRLTRGNP